MAPSPLALNDDRRRVRRRACRSCARRLRRAERCEPRCRARRRHRVGRYESRCRALGCRPDERCALQRRSGPALARAGHCGERRRSVRGRRCAGSCEAQRPNARLHRAACYESRLNECAARRRHAAHCESPHPFRRVGLPARAACQSLESRAWRRAAQRRRGRIAGALSCAHRPTPAELAGPLGRAFLARSGRSGRLRSGGQTRHRGQTPRGGQRFRSSRGGQMFRSSHGGQRFRCDRSGHA